MNRQTFQLALPYLCALAFAAALVWDGSLARVRWAEVKSGAARRVDPVCGMSVGPGIEWVHDGATRYFCSERCRARYRENPTAFAPAAGAARADAAPPMHTMLGIPGAVYYSSIALLLVLSFGLFEWLASRRRAPARPREREEEAPPRIDLLASPWLARLLSHPWTRTAAQLPVVAAFLLIVAAGLFGDQDAAHNIGPLLTWTVWWGGLVILILYAGKAWCYVCPWDALAGWAASARRLFAGGAGAAGGARWPRALRNVWPATALFVLLTWVEIGFGVTLRPFATALLALAILGLAAGCALIFERRSFCRYACLVGRISGLYALFASVEVRAADRERCRSCETSSCYRGSERGQPCPTFEHLARLEQNTYCIACLECARTCERGNVALNLRPWGEDLIQHHAPRADEAYLALVMLALTAFHGLTMTGAWGRLLDGLWRGLGVGGLAGFTLGMAGLLAGPVAIYALLVALSRRLSGRPEIGYREYFIRYAYALLPIALFYHLAHNAEHLLLEGPKLIAVISDPLGRGWNLLGTAGWSVPPLLKLSTLWGLQVCLVLVGHVYSLWIARRAAGALFTDGKAALRSQLPMLAAMVLFSVLSLWLLRQPMEMRTSAM